MFTLDDVRDYLEGTNVEEEAKLFFAGAGDSVLSKEKEVTSTELIRSTKTGGSLSDSTKHNLKYGRLQNRENILQALVHQKHSGALGILREEEEIRELAALEARLREESIQMEQQRSVMSVQLKKAKHDELRTFAEQAEHDLVELEKKKQAWENDILKKQIEIDELQKSLNEDLDKELNEKYLTVLSGNEGESEVEDINDEQALAEAHAKRVAQNQLYEMSTRSQVKKSNIVCLSTLFNTNVIFPTLNASHIRPSHHPLSIYTRPPRIS